jgi:hypothetical protein
MRFPQPRPHLPLEEIPPGRRAATSTAQRRPDRGAGAALPQQGGVTAAEGDRTPAAGAVRRRGGAGPSEPAGPTISFWDGRARPGSTMAHPPTGGPWASTGQLR